MIARAEINYVILFYFPRKKWVLNPFFYATCCHGKTYFYHKGENKQNCGKFAETHKRNIYFKLKVVGTRTICGKQENCAGTVQIRGE